MNRLSRKIITLIAPVVATLLLFSTVASAHVTVTPTQSSTGEWETYTLKVPSEKDVATVQIDLRIPEGAEFKQYEPSPGWDVTIEGNKVSWKATGEGIQKGEFQRFYYTAKNPDTPGEIAWDAYQHYADGSLVQWSGEEGTKSPHSITSIVQTADSGDHQSHNSMVMDEEELSKSTSVPPVVYVALGVALLALLLGIISLFRKPRG